VFHFLTEHTAKELLEQAAIASPIFKTRWRWAANRSLQLLRMAKGKRIALQIQRTRVGGPAGERVSAGGGVL